MIATLLGDHTQIVHHQRMLNTIPNRCFENAVRVIEIPQFERSNACGNLSLSRYGKGLLRQRG
jgi:hypothetical protein